MPIGAAGEETRDITLDVFTSDSHSSILHAWSHKDL